MAEEGQVKSDDGMQRDGIQVYKPKLSYDREQPNPGPCWYCRCVDCCCGCLLGNPVPCLVRWVDCYVTYKMHKHGLYSGGKFDRKGYEGGAADMNVPAEPTGKSGLIILDEIVMSEYEPGVKIPVRIVKQVSTKLKTRKVVYFIHGGGW